LSIRRFIGGHFLGQSDREQADGERKEDSDGRAIPASGVRVPEGQLDHQQHRGGSEACACQHH
jgi:hypothetical protein